MTELRLQRHLAAHPERVWRALTRPEALAAWFWPPSFHTVVTAEPWPGGRLRIEAAAMAVDGEYVEVQPPHRLSFTWRWVGEEEETLVTIELAPAGAGTLLTLVHARFEDETTRDEHTTGWSDCLGRLPAFLAEDLDADDEPAGPDEPPAERSRRDPERRPLRPRLLGGPEEIEAARRPRTEQRRQG
jgi:uncharacterized protein YndB with AHSA1/START domain